MSTTLVWSTFADANCDSFNIYRAITGIAVTFPNALQTGDIFLFSATSPTQQTVQITATDITSVASAINTKAKGIKASISQTGTTLFIRCTANKDAKLKLYSCTFLTHTDQTVRIITPHSEFNFIASSPRVSGIYDYQYPDVNGDVSDWYYMTSVNSGVESLPTQNMQALPNPNTLCVVEGRVIDLQNRPITGAQVLVQSLPPVGMANNSGIFLPNVIAVTDMYGRWTLPLIQCQSVLFRIPSISYNQVVVIPAQTYVLFKDLAPIDTYFYAESALGEPVSK